MRTTIDFPEDLHQQARSLARDSGRSLSEVVSELMRRGLRSQPTEGIGRSAESGFPTVSIGRTLTTEDIRALEDDE